MKRIRGRDRLKAQVPRSSPLWAAIESAAAATSGRHPFDDAEVTGPVSQYYLQSGKRTERFVVAAGHQRFNLATHDPGVPIADLGPVEQDIVTFSLSPHPTLVVLVGGMGSGKSTTLRYIVDTYLDQHAIVFCNLDANVQLGVAGDSELSDLAIAQLLAEYVSTPLNRYIDYDEEMTSFWSWVLSEEAVSHPSIHIFSSSHEKLREELKSAWRSESPEAIEVRTQCKRTIQQNPFGNLTYQAARIDYYLTKRCRGDRSGLMIIVDNVDPLSPRVQFKILDLASRIQATARCKVLVSLRPLTYSSNLQAAHRTIEVIEHVGPDVIDLIEHRVKTRLLEVDLPHLSVAMREDGRERTVGETEARRWIGDILQVVVREPKSSATGEPSARAFIEGICGYSLRSALIVAPELFGSSLMAGIAMNDGDASRHRVRDHDVIRAALVGTAGSFVGRHGRCIDNVFDLGGDVTSCSCTSKIRCLKKLAASSNSICTLGEMRRHLACFGYDDQVILDTVNAVISQTKRLAWSDSVAQYPSLDGFQGTSLKISKAGVFYITYAIFNLEYVQEVHTDVLLPESETLEHDPKSFSDRLRSLELFVRYLVEQDQWEVKRLLLNNEAAEYVSTYDDGTLFSTNFVEALERQIANIGRAMMQGKSSAERHSQVTETLTRWRSVKQKTSSDAEVLRRKLTGAV